MTAAVVQFEIKYTILVNNKLKVTSMSFGHETTLIFQFIRFRELHNNYEHLSSCD